MRLRGHDLYLTIGLNLGEPACPFPTCGVRWEKTLWPIVLSEWATDDAPGPAFTTVANWRDYSWVEWQGVWYAQKAEAFKAVIDLPRRVPMPIELCLSIAESDPELPALRAHGWRVVSPRERVGDPDSYRQYIHGSRGEFSPVRPICSLGKSGWFSERSGCYLAAGRPVVMEDTGLGRHLPVGLGLLTYTDLESAARCLEAVQRDYARHALAARELLRSRSLAHLGARARLAGCNRRPSARRYPSFLHHTSLLPAERMEACPVSTLVSSPQQEGTKGTIDRLNARTVWTLPR